MKLIRFRGEVFVLPAKLPQRGRVLKALEDGDIKTFLGVALGEKQLARFGDIELEASTAMQELGEFIERIGDAYVPRLGGR